MRPVYVLAMMLMAGALFNTPTIYAQDDSSDSSPVVVDTTAHLHIETTPPGCTVYIDGNAVAGTITPCDIDIELGVHKTKQIEIGLAQNGYRDLVLSIQLQRGETLPITEELIKTASAAKKPAVPIKPATDTIKPTIQASTSAANKQKYHISTASAKKPALTKPAIQKPSQNPDSEVQQPVIAVPPKPIGMVMAQPIVIVTPIEANYGGMWLYKTLQCSNPINAVAYSPDGSGILYGLENGDIQQYNFNNAKVCIKPLTHSASINSIAYCPTGEYMASAIWDNTIRIWDMSSHNVVANLSEHTGIVFVVAISPDGKYLASAGDDKTIIIYDTATLKEVTRLTGHTDVIRYIAFSHDSTKLISASEDKTVIIWDIQQGIQINTINRFLYSIGGLSVSNDGQYLVVCCGDSVWLCRMDDGTAVRAFGLGDKASAVSFSVDGKVVIAGTSHGEISVWETNSGHCLGTYTDHKSKISSITFAPDQSSVASSDADGYIRIWKPSKN